MGGASDAANDSRRKTDINQLSKAIMIYKTSNPDTLLPVETCSIGSDCSSPEVFGNASMLKDPNGTYYTYKSSNGRDFTITSTLSDDDNYYFQSSTGLYVTSSTPLVAGVCGTANTTFYATTTDYGETTFCSSGVESEVPTFPEIGETVSWSCIGTEGTASCSANRIASSCIDVAGLDCEEFIDGNYIINKYTLTGNTTTSATWTAPAGVNNIDVLVVAGGGGGGGRSYCGGGGAGGFIERMSFSVVPDNIYDIKVGAGGLGGSDSEATNGDNSEFGDPLSGGLRSIGGGRGARAGVYAPNIGGSGGGGSHDTAGYTIGASASQPSSSWSGYGNSGATAGNSFGSGGGGAGSAGFSGAQSVAGGNGGTGKQSIITGLYYAGGGGGGMPADYPGGIGGSNTGGNGGNSSNQATDGATGTGSGGGGAGAYPIWTNNGGKGGSGVVIIRYLVSQ